MSRALLTIKNNSDRLRAVALVQKVPYGTRIELKASKRSLPQNALLWASLTEVSRQVEWHGLRLPASDWKILFMDALHREVRIIPNIDGTGFVAMGRSSSDLSKDEMSDLIELIFKFGAEHGVQFADAEVAA